VVEFRVGQRVRWVKRKYNDGSGPRPGKIYTVISVSEDYIGVRTPFGDNELISSGRKPIWSKGGFKLAFGITDTIKLCRTT